MNENLLIKHYRLAKKKYGDKAYLHLDEIFNNTKKEHKKDFKKKDHEQSWRAFKGKNFEKLIEYLIKDRIKFLGLKTMDGNTLERREDKNLEEEFALIKRKLLIDYGEYGYHLPDIDIVVYVPDTLDVRAVISVKTTLRERIAQSGYWKLKMQNQICTRHIKFYFVTADQDNTLSSNENVKKGRAIVETDIDKTGVLNESVKESNRVRGFENFIADLKELTK